MNIIRRLSGLDKRIFERISSANDLVLAAADNPGMTKVLREVFEQRTYADYFPFHQEATVVDIGAHVGFFSLFAYRNLAAAGRVISVEPDPINFQRLVHNLSINSFTQDHCVRAAVFTHDGTGELERGASTNHRLQAASPYATNALSVPLLSLSSLFSRCSLERIDFLKMDCEGAEYDILYAQSTEIFARIHTISLEFHHGNTPERTGLALARHLRTVGFQIPVYQHSPTRQGLNYGRLIATRSAL